MQRAAWEWETADGEVLALPVRDPVAGRGHPPVVIASEALAGQPGERVQQVRHGVRVVDLPVLLEAEGRAPMRQLLRSWARALDPARGAGVLRVTEPGQPAVELEARYSGGLELRETDPTWMPVVLTFRAHHPYWQDSEPVAATFTEGAGEATFFPLPPITLAGGTVWATPTVQNDGDVPAWPLWHVTGPGSTLELTNTTTGEMLTLDRPIASGEVVTIDTRPGAKLVESSAGGDLYAELELDSQLWPLAPGANVLAINLGSAGAESSVQMTYRRGYLAS